MSRIDSPIPLPEIESVLAWVDTFKLSRPTKKIGRDFSDAVLLAEILHIHYPKLVEMHNYPPRNSHSLKLNNWMTLNRKVLKKLKLHLCCDTMDQLANGAPGVIERVLVMVREKIRRDEDLNKSLKDNEHNVSSGGSYYEACGDEDNVLVVPIKTRINGVLETIQQKVVSYEAHRVLKEELKDAMESIEVLKQKVDHLDNLLKLKDERIDELQKQLERKQSRRKEAENFQNSLAVPFDPSPPSPIEAVTQEIVNIPITTSTAKVKSKESLSKIPKLEESKIPVPKASLDGNSKTISQPSITEVIPSDVKDITNKIEIIKSEVFKEIEIIEDKSDGDLEVFKDSEQEVVTTISDTIQKEINNITIPIACQEKTIECNEKTNIDTM